VRVHGPVMTDVHNRTRCGSMKADPTDIGPEATPEGASVSSDRRAQALVRLLHSALRCRVVLVAASGSDEARPGPCGYAGTTRRVVALAPFFEVRTTAGALVRYRAASARGAHTDAARSQDHSEPRHR